MDMNTNLTRVTVITVCYNAESTIERTMRSVLAQDYDNIEYVIIDGKSDDSTCKLIKKTIKRYNNVVFVSENDSGIYDAMNKGIFKATGEYIIFMNAGDTFVDCTVVSRVMKQANGETVLYGNHYTVLGNKRKKHFPSKLNGRPHFCHQASFTRRNALVASPFDVLRPIKYQGNMIKTSEKFNRGGTYWRRYMDWDECSDCRNNRNRKALCYWC